jgi:hypothetical protein
MVWLHNSLDGISELYDRLDVFSFLTPIFEGGSSNTPTSGVFFHRRVNRRTFGKV